MVVLLLTGPSAAADESPVTRWIRDHVPPQVDVELFGLETWQWVYGALLVVVAWMIAMVVRVVLQSQVERALKRVGLVIDPANWEPTKGPLVWLVLIGVVTAGLPDLQLPNRVADPLIRLATVGWWLLAIVTLQRFVVAAANSSRRWAQRTDSRLDDQAIPLLTQAARLLVIVFGGLYAADAAGIDVWKLAAGVGLGGLALALAAQDTVANLFGSVNIFFDRPFQIGDWIKLGDVEGVVEEVGFRSTRVRTGHDSVVTVPNSKITSSNVDNFGARPRRKVELRVGLAPDTAPDRVVAFVDGVRQLLALDAAVQPDAEAAVSAIGGGSITVAVGYHLVAAEQHREAEVRQRHLVAVLGLAAETGVALA